jgi:hypothetical protein
VIQTLHSWTVRASPTILASANGLHRNCFETPPNGQRAACRVVGSTARLFSRPLRIDDISTPHTEWKIDMDSPKDTHRHLSHLIGVGLCFPTNPC